MCLGQEVQDCDGERCVMHQMTLEFSDDEDEIVLVSRMKREDKRLTLWPYQMQKLLPKDADPSNSTLRTLAGRVILREIWWYNKGVEEHETTLAHLLSPVSKVAFASGYEQQRQHEKRSSN